MGNKRQFNESDVLRQLALHFWKHGYSATKVDQLSAVTGLTKTSLYNAFGNKEELFLSSLKFYIDRSIKEIADILDKEKSISVNLESLLELSFLRCDSTTLSYGCLLTNSIVELNANEQRLHDEATKFCENVREVIYELFKYYVSEGKVSSEYSAEELSDYFMTIWQGLRVQSRNPKAVKQLNNTIQSYLKFIRSIENPDC